MPVPRESADYSAAEGAIHPKTLRQKDRGTGTTIKSAA